MRTAAIYCGALRLLSALSIFVAADGPRPAEAASAPCIVNADGHIDFVIVAIAVVYSEPVDGGLFLGFALPIIGILSVYYLLRISGSMIFTSGLVIYYFMDVSSPSVFRSVILPVMLGLTVIVFGIWAWKRDHMKSGAGWADPGSTGDGSGGDCGGGDGGRC